MRRPTFIITNFLCVSLASCAFAGIGKQVELPSVLKTYMNYWEAKEYCESVGSRLPTARDYAEFARTKGAVGIAQSDNPKYYIHAGPDEFYYNSTGYDIQMDDQWLRGFWTGSVPPSSPENAYMFWGAYGILVYSRKVNLFAVRCMINP